MPTVGCLWVLIWKPYIRSSATRGTTQAIEEAGEEQKESEMDYRSCKMMTAIGWVLTIASTACAQMLEPTRDHALTLIARGRRSNAGLNRQPFFDYIITPHAVIAKDKVYCAFQNDKGQPLVMVYDLVAKTATGPVTASTFGLGDDDHGNPALHVDTKGHVHVFYGCHGGAMKHSRSVKPCEIDEWAEQISPTPRATYPQVMELADGTVCLFYRAGGHIMPWTMRTSTDDCTTWSKGTLIIEMRLKPPDPRAGAYCHFFPGSDGKTIHCFWNFKDDDPRRRPKEYAHLNEAVYRYNIYYVQRDADGTWRNAADEPITLPVSKAEADAKCMVFDSSKKFAYPVRQAVDSRNRPYVLISTGVRDWARKEYTVIPMRPNYATLRGQTWSLADELPKDWPPEVRTVIQARGYEAFGDLSRGRWFIFYRYLTSEETGETGIFLHDEKGNYAVQSP